MRNTIVSLTALLLTSACATNYLPPPNSDVSLVRFSVKNIGAEENAYFLSVRPGPDCKNSVGQSLARLGAAIGNNRVSPTRMIGSTGKPSRLVYERPLESGADIRVFAYWQEPYNPYGRYYSCAVGAKLDLIKGKQYELAFDTRMPCDLHLYELSESSAGIKMEETPIRIISVEQSTDLCSL